MTGIILDYVHLLSENPRPLPFLEKKNLGGDIHLHPHLKPLYSQSFLQSTSMTLIIINPLHSRVAHMSFDFFSFAPVLYQLNGWNGIYEYYRVNRSHKMLTMSPVVETRGLKLLSNKVLSTAMDSCFLMVRSFTYASRVVTQVEKLQKNNFENFSKFDITRYIFPGGSTDHC